MILPNKANLPVAKLRELGVRERENVLLSEVYRTVRRPVQTSQKIQQRTFACAGLADQRQALSAIHLEGEAGENHQVAAAGLELLGKVDATDGCGVGGLHFVLGLWV